MRYRIGFKSRHMSCLFMDENPGFVPIVECDLHVVALCEDFLTAKEICRALNGRWYEENLMAELNEQENTLITAWKTKKEEEEEKRFGAEAPPNNEAQAEIKDASKFETCP